jgi:gas vesicle protein
LAASTIALIVIGAVVGAAALAFASKKGYDKLVKSRVEASSVNNNPIYEASTDTVQNPMCETVNN